MKYQEILVGIQKGNSPEVAQINEMVKDLMKVLKEKNGQN